MMLFIINRVKDIEGGVCRAPAPWAIASRERAPLLRRRRAVSVSSLSSVSAISAAGGSSGQGAAGATLARARRALPY
ncbi:unnamed protein product [Leptosia nina]|uniref:Uncharacterized protein n=1 Tax=Leptosia nina TaxID=320188 RepID=A0AAV1JRC0_9NEOP